MLSCASILTNQLVITRIDSVSQIVRPRRTAAAGGCGIGRGLHDGRSLRYRGGQAVTVRGALDDAEILSAAER